MFQHEMAVTTATIDTPDADAILAELKTLGWTLDLILNTHWHPDHAGGNAAIQLMDEVSQNVRGHRGVMINAGVARDMGIEEGDLLEVTSAIGATQGPAIVVQGIRPDTLVMVGQFDYWATPYAKDLESPSLNTIAPMSLELTDATGSGADIVRVSVKRLP